MSKAALKAESDLVGFHVSNNADLERGGLWLHSFECANSTGCRLPFSNRVG